MLRAHDSAFKHGIELPDIHAALNQAWQRHRIGEDPERFLYLGFDRSMRPLEIVTIIGDDGHETIIHAMKMRKQYRERRETNVTQ